MKKSTKSGKRKAAQAGGSAQPAGASRGHVRRGFRRPMNARSRERVRALNSTLTSVVDELVAMTGGPESPFERSPGGQSLPSREVVIDVVEALREVIFPGYYGVPDLSSESMHFHVGSTLDQVMRKLQEQVERGLCFVCHGPADHCDECEDRALTISKTFLATLPDLRHMLSTDVRAAYEGDPAATSPDETIFCYPGVLAVTNYRLAHELYVLGVPIIPRMITEHAHSLTGIDIHPGARIGESFFIDHGTGVVIGETCIIGNRVRIYQGVTLGAKSFPLDAEGNPIKGVDRHPVVEDDVIIYSGATILGRIVIGRGSVIGGNVWLTHSVPPDSHITQAETGE